MSAFSGGWSDLIKFIVDPNAAHSQSEFKGFLEAIIARKCDFTEYAYQCEPFLSMFSHIVTDQIVENLSKINIEELDIYVSVSKILLEYLVRIINRFSSHLKESRPYVYLSAIKDIIISVKTLCTATKYTRDTSRQSFNILLSKYDPPPLLSLSSPENRDSKIRQNFMSLIQHSLSKPLYTFSSEISVVKGVTSFSKSVKKYFTEKNENYLQILHGGEYLIDLCLLLPTLAIYFKKYESNLLQGSFPVPANFSEAHHVENQVSALHSEIEILFHAMSVNVMEPLNDDKLRKLTNISGGCLYCSAHITTMLSINGIRVFSYKTPDVTGNVFNVEKYSDEDFTESISSEFVEKSMQIFGYVQAAIKSSTRAHKQALQNNLMNTSFMLICSMSNYMYGLANCATDKSLKQDKGKTSSKMREREKDARMNWIKTQQLYSNIALSLLSLAITSLSALFDDIAGEPVTECDVVPARLSITQSSTALERIARVFKTQPNTLIQFLVFVAPLLYRKACSPKRLSVPNAVPATNASPATPTTSSTVPAATSAATIDGDAFNVSDLGTYYEDDLVSCSNEESASDEDDDSEPILGHWFEETILSANEGNPIYNKETESSDSHGYERSKVFSLIPEKGSPVGYVSVATDIFTFLNNHIVSSDFALVQQALKDSLSDTFIVAVAAVVRDLDREAASIARCGDSDVIYLYKCYSISLMAFVHNLLTRNILDEALQNFLLTCLGVSPFTDATAPWPMMVQCRSLSVLAQVLLSRNNKESACVIIWNRVLHTLRKHIICKSITSEVSSEGLNIEHAQILMFFFNSLSFMQKKTLLLTVMEAVIEAGNNIHEIDEISQYYYLARLLLFFEYMVKYLYDPPDDILEQVQYNITGTGLHELGNIDFIHSKSKTYSTWKDIASDYWRYGPDPNATKKHPFYDLSGYSYSNQETPKLDGLALNFMLNSGSTDSGECTYTNLLSSLSFILQAIDWCKLIQFKQINYETLCAIRYCVSIGWRLLLQLPPSVNLLDKIMVTRGEFMQPFPLMLYVSFWGPRCNQKLYINWLKDILSKQGHAVELREMLLRSVSDITSAVKYNSTLVKRTILSVMSDSDSKGVLISKLNLPNYFNIMFCDVMISKFQVLIDDTWSRSNDSDMNSLINHVVNLIVDSSDTDNTSLTNKCINENAVDDVAPLVLQLIQHIHACIRSCLLHQINECGSVEYPLSDLVALGSVISVAGYRTDKDESLLRSLPDAVHSVIQKWANIIFPDFNISGCINVAESFALSVMNFHMAATTNYEHFSLNPSLKHLLHTLVKFVCDHIIKMKNENGLHDKVADAVAPLLLDVSTASYLRPFISTILTSILGDETGQKYQVRVQKFIFQHIFTLLLNYTNSPTTYENMNIHDTILYECMTWIEQLVSDPNGRLAIQTFFDDHKRNPMYGLQSVLISIISPKINGSKVYILCVLQTFNKLFSIAETNSETVTMQKLMECVPYIAEYSKSDRDLLFYQIIIGHYFPSIRMLQEVIADLRAKYSVKSGSGHENDSDDDSKPDSNHHDMKEIVSKDANVAIRKASSEFLEHLTIIIRQSDIENKDYLAYVILESLIPVASDVLLILNGCGFDEVMKSMISFADIAGFKGHILLFKSALNWISQQKIYLHTEDILVNLKTADNSGEHLVLAESICYILNYVSDVLQILCSSSSGQLSSLINWDADILPSGFDLNNDWSDELYNREENDDAESAEDDSDEDNLFNKLCTFTITQKEFMNQHWYHCHTCKMIDKVGVCSICARVCHKGHDVTYAKYGNFFCDCGAKNDGFCLALTKRSAEPNVKDASTSTSTSPSHAQVGMSFPETAIPSPLRKRVSSRSEMDKLLDIALSVRSLPKDKYRLMNLAKQLEPYKEEFFELIWNDSTSVDSLLSLCFIFSSFVETICAKISPVGCHKRAKEALDRLHHSEKSFDVSDKLMVPTIGSQEGAFESIRLNFSGDQGQTIRQLISANLIHRVSMCCLSSPQGKRQHLVAVSHEKNKVTVYQLNSLLKQVDSSKKKLTLTRLSSTSIPFTILSVTGNPCNEDYLAVCGLKECHVLTFSSVGTVSDHIVLHPQLETANFIIRAIWLPGSQTCLALVTADFVKIYELSKDILSPQYYFLVPSGKIRDVTFVCREKQNTFIIIMSSFGYVYIQEMNDESSASLGSFFVTNTLKVEHPGIKDSSGLISLGGVSIYYSHVLKILFFSFAAGKSFMAFLSDIEMGISKIYEIYLNSSAKSSVTSGSKNSGPLGVPPLYQWTEIVNHPGLVCSVVQSTNNPVVLMIKPDNIMIQEIKVVPAKSKIMDMVLIRHSSLVSDNRTTLLLLCEDGSLRIYTASMENTGYWLSPEIRPVSSIPNKPSSKKSKSSKSADQQQAGSEMFPVDFFEHCTALTDIEFGGNDVLQIYNTAQLKTRLNTPGLYIVSTKQGGFSITAINNDSNMIITGIRVLVGVQDPQKSPSYVDVYGRLTPTASARNRWFDIPLTRAESLMSDQRITIVFGQSTDPECITIINSIKVYGKTKEQFGCLEDAEEVNGNSTPVTGGSTAQTPANDSDNISNNPQLQITHLDKLMCSVMNVLENCFNMLKDLSVSQIRQLMTRSSAITLSIRLMNLPTSFCIQLYARALLAAMHKTRQAYHSYKDTAMLINVFETLASFTDVSNAQDLDPELFYHIILTVRGIAVPRPQNIVKFTLPAEATGEKKPTAAITGTAIQLLNLLVEITWRLHEARPSNPMLPAICVPGLAHVESTVFALVEIIHAFAINDSNDFTISMVMKLYIELLLHEDVTISFAAKTAIISVLKPKLKQKKAILNSCPSRTAPGSSKTVEKEESPEVMEIEDDTEPEAFSGLVHSNNEPNNSVNVQEILSATNGYPPVDLLDDVPDEEAMVELAIALSMQEHGGEVEIQEVIPDFDPESLPDLNSSSELHELHIVSESQSADNQASNQETGHLSDTTASASAAGSDDEGSTAAVDENARASSSEQTVVPDTELESERDAEMNNDLHKLRIILLERFISHLSDCKPNGGLKIIPFFQVLYALTSDLSARDENYISILDNLLNISVAELGISNEDLPYESYTEPLLANYSAETKYHFILLKFLSVLLNNVKSAESQNDKLAIIAEMISNRLHEAGFIKWALHIHKKLLPYWKSFTTEDPNIVTGALLKPNTLVSMPDISPFYLKQSSKANVTDIFELYPQLLTELMVRIPYQIQKYSTRKTTFDQEWFNLLCDYMMTQQTPFVKRSVRKLLLHIGPSKDSYRQRRDNHALESHLKEVFEITGLPWNKSCEEYPGPISLPYDQLLKIVEHLKASVEVAFTRTSNWRKFLLSHEPFISHLFILSCALEDSVASLIIQLLQYAICAKANTLSANGVIVTAVWKPEIPIKKESTTEKDSKSNSEEIASKKFLSKIRPFINDDVLSRFMSTFVLETNSTYLRYQAHFLLLYFFRFSDEKNQDILEELAWNLWPKLPTCGRKAYLYIDLLGYFTVKCSGISKIPDKMNDHFSTAVRLLRSQNQILMRHSNSSLYSQISQYVEMEGFYLESEPCMVCNNPEVPYSTTKLQSIKADSKFTTNSQIIKLISSHTINRINLRISDLKRTKMVRTIILYYNNRCVQAAVELKNKPALWHKAKKISLLSAQTEVKIDFPLPIVACNLMIEYVDFYENLQSSSENLTCPRCSASVPSSPGICNNCGENVFQCHKCRAINYDEKDPFLCHVCGFCKYAKFDYTLTCRPVCAIEPIMNDEDRRKVLTTISVLLEKADRLYKQLTSYKPVLESLLSKISEHRIDHGFDDSNVHSSSSHSIQVNKTIQLLAQKYCTDCKNSFDELSKIIQKILVCRRELVAYDQKQLENNRSSSSSSRKRSKTSRSNSGSGAVVEKTSLSIGMPGAGRCYGCASFVVEHCITILRAVCLNVDARKVLRKQGLIHELVEHNLRRGSNQLQEDVRQLLCILVRDSAKATEDLCSLLFDRISTLLKSHVAHSDLPTAVRPEIVLLGALIQINDSCWEQKARCITKLFLLACKECKSPIVLESVILPCLCIIQSLIQPEGPKSKKYKDKNMESLATVRSTEYINIDLRKWLQNNDNKHTFKVWKQRTPLKESSVPKPETKKEVKERYLMEKCFLRWKERSLPDSYSKQFRIIDSGWIKPALFNSSSRQVRLVTSSLIYSLCDLPARKKQMLDILTSFLGETSASGQYSSEFLDLYQLLIKEEPWKIYVTLRRVLTYLADLISKEIQTLHELEGTTLTSDMSQGYVLKKLVELISSFFEVNTIKRRYKGRLVGSILNGYLSLRRLVIQRTRIIDETQEKLLELLEGMTTGTEAETRSFMAVCIATVDKCSMDDIKTPVFIFERLCSIIFPEENEVSDFYLSLEKDPQQEDFLQGRMLGNPYSSSEPGLGPLMRDVKNKICQDCELIALLEDDNGMELLVNNKIISLDLPVKLVYKKIWLAGGAGESEPMRVIYRMRGLLGDATEEFIETLNSKTDEEVNNEEVYKLATTMGDCGGLHSLLKRLDAINDLNRYQELTRVCLKLLLLCVKVKSNQDILIQPEMGAMRILLDKLKLCLETSDSFTDSVLSIIETLLSRATSDEADYKKLSDSYAGSYYIKMILQQIPSIKSPILSRLMHVAAALTYGNDSIMKILTDYFLPVIHFEQFDADRSVEDEEKLDTFCILTAAIDRNSLGNTFKNYLLYAGFVDLALDYITRHAVCLKSSYRRTDSDEWKNYISRPALKYIIRYLTGLAYNHTPTQLMVSAECISIIHRLEQVSSDEHVGTLAENLLEALRTHPKVASRIENVREQTKAEKKRLAMAMREKQLGALGMRTNEKGQVTAETSILQQLEELGEETGLVCVICREGYRFQPNKVLGIYTFTKRCPVEEFENKTRKTLGYSTVTHFNVIHIDCHMSAVRQARTRDEWESAMLQNGNTKCNGLLPLWGPQVTESAFASCLARHNSYLQECTGHRDVTHTSSIHDLKLLLLRFAREKSFHEDTGGGGPQSNMNLIPYLMHLALYVINATKSYSREEKNLMSFLESNIPERWIASAYETEGPFYWLTFSMLLQSPQEWQKYKITYLRRLIVVAHVRHLSPSAPTEITDLTPQDYSVYKSTLVFFGLVNMIYKYTFKKFKTAKVDQWSVTLAEYIRFNDEALLKSSEKLMSAYENELLGAASFEEYWDLTEILDDNFENRSTFVADVLKKLNESSI